jgi:hypothetical protein
MAGKCEHGLTTKECFVCASPKHGAGMTPADLLPLPEPERKAVRHHPDFYTATQMHAYALAHIAAPPQVQPPARDREADRARFPDPAFNRWLDEGISDAGHTVWDQVGSVVDAWHGWENRPFYAPPQVQQGEPSPSEAVYGFAGWLTCRDEAVTMGSTHNAAPVADLVQQFVESQGWAEPRPSFADRLKTYPKAPQGEPVAGVVWDDEYGASLIKRGTEDEWCATNGTKRLYLAAAPPQVQPQPLTDEQIAAAFPDCADQAGGWETCRLIASAVERAHRIKP